VLAFIAVPLVELYVLIQVGSVIGALPTISLCVLSAVAGAALIRHQGLVTLMRVRTSLDRGELPAVELVEGVLLLIAGAMLLTPGFLTDIVGFVLLVPPVRRALAVRFIASRSVRMAPDGRPAAGSPGVIEGEFRRLDE
jgi:UPF0716 protein FxsA